MADAYSKRCPKCGDDKPLSSFYKSGAASYCIPCEKSYKHDHYLKNRDSIRAKSIAWSRANPDRKSATHKEWRAANKERLALIAKQWSERNRDKRLAASTKYRTEKLDRARANEQAYRDRNREACNVRIRDWKKKNKHMVVAHAGKRRAAELNSIPAWADLSAIAAIYREARERRLSVDHIVPLVSERVCGLHCEANMQLLTISENAKKNNRRWPDMWPDV